MSTAVGAFHIRPSGALARAVLGQRTATLFDALFPSATIAHRLIAIAVLIAATAALAQARFFLPDNPVPITFQTFGVLLTGGVLGMRWGLVSAIGYYLVGMAGLPVFQSGGNGWEYVAHGATGGYLLGFIVATALVGYASERGLVRGQTLWAMLAGALAVYLPALIWLSVFDFGWPADGELFSSAMYPFIPGDLLKLVLAAISTGLLWRVADARAAGRDRGGNTGR